MRITWGHPKNLGTTRTTSTTALHKPTSFFVVLWTLLHIILWTMKELSPWPRDVKNQQEHNEMVENWTTVFIQPIGHNGWRTWTILWNVEFWKHRVWFFVECIKCSTISNNTKICLLSLTQILPLVTITSRCLFWKQPVSSWQYVH